MKPEIHPTYYDRALVHCACGNSFYVGSTKDKIEVEICSACHPFFTGGEKVLDIAGRVEKFKARRAAASAKVTAAGKTAAANPAKLKTKKPGPAKTKKEN